MKKLLYCGLFFLGLAAPAGCIKNDIPYPKIEQNIRTLAVEGESKSAYIDSVTQEATVYLDETTDIENVRFTEFSITPGGHSNKNLLDSTWNLTKPLYVTLSRFQDYVWTIRAVQEIERYFQVEGEVGQSVVDPVARRVIVHVPVGTDLSDLLLTRVKLGPEGITTMQPDLRPGALDLRFPLRVEVTAWGRTEIWTIYAEMVESVVTTSQVDAWSKVVWAYGAGPADVSNGFQYRKSGESQWTDVPESRVTQTQGSFSCYIPHLEPLTEYEVRAVSGENMGNVVKVTTESTVDIVDGDFENWSKSGKMWQPWGEGDDPYWGTGNNGSAIAGKNVTEPTDHTASGSGQAAKLQNLSVIGILASGSLYTGRFVKVDGTNGILNFGRPFGLHPTHLKGYFQYESKPISNVGKNTGLDYLRDRPDSCHIYVALTDWTAPYEIRTNPNRRQLFNPNADYVIGYGELVCGDVMSGYQQFDIKINYKRTDVKPTYLQITFTSAKYGDYFTGGVGSTLYVDQIYFDWDY